MKIFPSQNEIESIPEDGFVFRLPHICHKVYGAKCKAFYEEISSKEGFFVCPYGFNSYSIPNDSEILTGLILKDKKSKKLSGRNFHEDDYTANLSSRELVALRAKMRLAGVPPKKVEVPPVKTNAAKFELPIETLDNTVHELRKLNINLKTESNNLNYECQNDNPDYETIRDRARNVYNTSSLISIRLDTYDFLTNPELATAFKKTEIKIYKKFEKSLHILKYQAYRRGITIKMEGASTNKIWGYDIFEILPFILFENAIKYSFEDSDVICRFEEPSESITRITVQNQGIVPEKSEINSLIERGKRSANVREEYDGNGIGLFLADQICKLHNINMEVKYSNTTEEDKNGNFYVNIFIDINAANNA